MSRTYRRKNTKAPIKTDWCGYGEFLRRYYRDKYPHLNDEEIIKREAVEYHKENHPGEWNVPGGYGKWLNKKVKNRNRLTLIRDLRNDGEFDMIPIKKDSGWQYW